MSSSPHVAGMTDVSRPSWLPTFAPACVQAGVFRSGHFVHVECLHWSLTGFLWLVQGHRQINRGLYHGIERRPFREGFAQAAGYIGVAAGCRQAGAGCLAVPGNAESESARDAMAEYHVVNLTCCA